MTTTIKAGVTLAVALKIYSNYLRANPPFKPWKGMEGCAWFGYDGNPNAGDPVGQGKTIVVEAEADIAANTPFISGADLKKDHAQRMRAKNMDYPRAEGQMWHDDVGALGFTAPGGMLIVQVGGSQFSKDPGKYLLVNNRRLSRLSLTRNKESKQSPASPPAYGDYRYG